MSSGLPGGAAVGDHGNGVPSIRSCVCGCPRGRNGSSCVEGS
jgi:hypothetical protein